MERAVSGGCWLAGALVLAAPTFALAKASGPDVGAGLLISFAYFSGIGLGILLLPFALYLLIARAFGKAPSRGFSVMVRILAALCFGLNALALVLATGLAVFEMVLVPGFAAIVAAASFFLAERSL